MSKTYRLTFENKPLALILFFDLLLKISFKGSPSSTLKDTYYCFICNIISKILIDQHKVFDSFIVNSIFILFSSIIFSVKDAFINSYCLVIAILSISFNILLMRFDE